MSNRRRIFDDELWAHFVTFSCYRRRKLLDLDLDLDRPRQILLGVLNQQLQQQKATCIGFVVMPDHTHAIVWFPQPNQLSRFMQGWKRKSSFRIRNWYRDKADQYFTSRILASATDSGSQNTTPSKLIISESWKKN